MGEVAGSRLGGLDGFGGAADEPNVWRGGRDFFVSGAAPNDWSGGRADLDAGVMADAAATGAAGIGIVVPHALHWAFLPASVSGRRYFCPHPAQAISNDIVGPPGFAVAVRSLGRHRPRVEF